MRHNSVGPPGTFFRPICRSTLLPNEVVTTFPSIPGAAKVGTIHAHQESVPPMTMSRLFSGLKSLSILVFLLVIAHASANASCANLRSYANQVMESLKNEAAAAGVSTEDVVKYRNSAIMNMYKVKMEPCTDAHTIAYSMIASAMYDQSRALEDLTASQQSKVNSCKVLAIVLAQYRIADAWTALHYAFNHADRGDDFQRVSFYESRESKRFFVPLPSYAKPMKDAILFKSHYNALRSHYVAITPDVCSLDNEIEETTPLTL